MSSENKEPCWGPGHSLGGKEGWGGALETLALCSW